MPCLGSDRDAPYIHWSTPHHALCVPQGCFHQLTISCSYNVKVTTGRSKIRKYICTMNIYIDCYCNDRVSGGRAAVKGFCCRGSNVMPGGLYHQLKAFLTKPRCPFIHVHLSVNQPQNDTTRLPYSLFTIDTIHPWLTLSSVCSFSEFLSMCRFRCLPAGGCGQHSSSFTATSPRQPTLKKHGRI